jgi:HTH-type transcriptional regulator/antitoxin MqsA
MARNTVLDLVRARKRLPSPAIRVAIRKEARVTQAQMADQLGVHRVTFASWEKGDLRPTDEHCLAYLELLEALQKEAVS